MVSSLLNSELGLVVCTHHLSTQSLGQHVLHNKISKQKKKEILRIGKLTENADKRFLRPEEGETNGQWLRNER